MAGAAWALAVIAGLSPVSAWSAEPPAASVEYQVKAVFLFNFAQFVEWPPRVFPDRQSPIVIGILGEDPFGAYLDDLVRGEKIRDRPIVIRRFARLDDVADCQILFISRSEAAQLDKIFARLKGKSIFTVGDVDNFAVQGGMVRLVTENNKIQLKINLQAALDAGLTISSKLLRPATLVTPPAN